jgi:hypothetical protein
MEVMGCGYGGREMVLRRVGECTCGNVEKERVRVERVWLEEGIGARVGGESAQEKDTESSNAESLRRVEE